MLTLNMIFEGIPSAYLIDSDDPYDMLLKYLNKEVLDNEPIAFKTIYDAVGVHCAIWLLNCLPAYDKRVLKFIAECKRRVVHLNKSDLGLLNDLDRCVSGDLSVAELRANYPHFLPNAANTALYARDDIFTGVRLCVEAYSYDDDKARAAELDYQAELYLRIFEGN